MIFEFSMLPMVISLTVAALCLTFSLFQALVALKRPEFPWNKWGAGLSLLTAIYAVAVFFQYNLAEEPANILCERVQYTIFPCWCMPCSVLPRPSFLSPAVVGISFY
jgi:hypothetical protein